MFKILNAFADWFSEIYIMDSIGLLAFFIVCVWSVIEGILATIYTKKNNLEKYAIVNIMIILTIRIQAFVSAIMFKWYVALIIIPFLFIVCRRAEKYMFTVNMECDENYYKIHRLKLSYHFVFYLLYFFTGIIFNAVTKPNLDWFF